MYFLVHGRHMGKPMAQYVLQGKCWAVQNGSGPSGQLLPQPENLIQQMLLGQAWWVQFHIEAAGRKGGCDASHLQPESEDMRSLVVSAMWVVSSLPHLPYCSFCVQGVHSNHVCLWSALQGPRDQNKIPFSETKGQVLSEDESWAQRA